MKALFTALLLSQLSSVFAADILPWRINILEPPKSFVFAPVLSPEAEQTSLYLRWSREYYSAGRYDLALHYCERILRINPYSIAARRMRERITTPSIYPSDIDTPRERQYMQPHRFEATPLTR